MSASLARLGPSSSGDERRVVSFPHCPTVERINAGRTLNEAQRLDLERLRWLALRAQLAPRADLERACYVLAGQPAASLDRLATVFFRGLSERASSEMVIYRPGAASVSDDECWLLRLVSACRDGQDAAAGALVAWRVAPSARRWMRFLSSAMVRALDAA